MEQLTQGAQRWPGHCQSGGSGTESQRTTTAHQSRCLRRTRVATHSLLDVADAQASGEVCLACRSRRGRDLQSASCELRRCEGFVEITHDVAAVDELALVVTEHSHLPERLLELHLELLLVVYHTRSG